MTLLPFPKWISGILLAGMVVIVTYKGILPSLVEISSDFPNYYTAGTIVISGDSADRIYDDEWFQQEMNRIGFAQQGKFAPFPPATALLGVPLALNSPLVSLRVLTIVNITFVVLSIILLSQSTSMSLMDSGILVFTSGLGLINCFRLGQLYIILSFLMILGYWLYKREYRFFAGLVTGVFVPIKFFPVVLIAFFAMLREWRVVLGACFTIGFVSCLSVVVLGWQAHQTFLIDVLPRHLSGDLTMQDPFSATFQSFQSLFRRMFVFDQQLNPHPFVDSHALFTVFRLLIPGMLLAALLYLGIRVHGKNEASLTYALFGLSCIFMLVISPATATYHTLLLWLPVGLLVSPPSVLDVRMRIALILLYCVLGWIPYRFFLHFDEGGLQTMLAYPRLGILTLMFIVSSRALSVRLGETLGGRSTF